MAQECTDNTVTISSSTATNWANHSHAGPLPSWTNTSPWHQSTRSSHSSCEEDASVSKSFSGASNRSGLTVDSSRRVVEPASSTELLGEHASDSQIWSHILLGIGNQGDLHNSQDVGEDLLDLLSSKSNVSPEIFEHGCDYFKKMDSSWELKSSPSFNSFEKQLSGFNENLIDSGRLTKLSPLVSHLSIGPPDPEVNCQIDHLPCSIYLSSSENHHSQPQTYNDSTPCAMETNRTLGFLSCYGHDLKVENEQHDTQPSRALFRRSFNSNDVGYHTGLSTSVIGDNCKHNYGLPEATSKGAKNFADSLTSRNRLMKPLADIQVPRPSLETLNSSDCRRQQLQASSPTLKRQGDAGKKKRSEEMSEAITKKPKHENSTATSLKMQAPKIKLSERITALQQIVSPFGRTDTASVLYEAIEYIKFLQEQVQLLTNHYMKPNPRKDVWGSLDRKDKGDAKLDLCSKGLCLVPISCTPQVYHEHAGSDYWTPTYRGCLYR